MPEHGIPQEKLALLATLLRRRQVDQHILHALIREICMPDLDIQFYERVRQSIDLAQLEHKVAQDHPHLTTDYVYSQNDLRAIGYLGLLDTQQVKSIVNQVSRHSADLVV